jgi:ATP-dependent exoDNAse (exonuclease V) beta subunit
MEYDKVNGDVGFLEGPHRYENLKDPTIKYTSVTTLIGKYEPEFDKDFVSKYKALERLLSASDWKKEKGGIWKSKKIPKDFLEVYNISEKELNKVQQDILDEWAKINKESCERGTKIHAQLENSFYKAGTNITLKKFGIGGKFECKKNYNELDLEYGIYPEYLIYYDNPKLDLHIAGQIDLLVKSGNDIWIGDHKTNKKIDLKGFYNSSSRSTEKLKYPLTDLDNCNFNVYQLQLSTYAWMLQKINPNFVIKDLILNHYDHDGNNTLYHCSYLKDDVEKMLKHFARQNKLDKQKKKYERIEY